MYYCSKLEVITSASLKFHLNSPSSEQALELWLTTFPIVFLCHSVSSIQLTQFLDIGESARQLYSYFLSRDFKKNCLVMWKVLFVNMMLLNPKLLEKLGLCTKTLPDSWLDLKCFIWGSSGGFSGFSFRGFFILILVVWGFAVVVVFKSVPSNIQTQSDFYWNHQFPTNLNRNCDQSSVCPSNTFANT